MTFYPDSGGTVHLPSQPGGRLNALTEVYQKAYWRSPASEFIAGKQLGQQWHRGCTTREWFRLGYVAKPGREHAAYVGRLVIPYSRSLPNGRDTIAFRFACVEPGCDHAHHAAVTGPPMDRPRLFNDKYYQGLPVTVCFGEIDTMTAFMLGVAAIGIPSVEGWRDEFAPRLAASQLVRLVVPHHDGGAAAAVAERVREAVPSAVVVDCPDGKDLNSAYCAGVAKPLLTGTVPSAWLPGGRGALGGRPGLHHVQEVRRSGLPRKARVDEHLLRLRDERFFFLPI